MKVGPTWGHDPKAREMKGTGAPFWFRRIREVRRHSSWIRRIREVRRQSSWIRRMQELINEERAGVVVVDGAWGRRTERCIVTVVALEAVPAE